MKQVILMILIVSTVSHLSGQSRCDTLHDEIFQYTNEPPIPSISYKDLAVILNNTISLNDIQLPEENVIHLIFIINCNGEDFNYRTQESINNKFKDILVETIKSNMTWTPAKHNNKQVDFQKTLIISIDKGKFRLSDNIVTTKKKRK